MGLKSNFYHLTSKANNQKDFIFESIHHGRPFVTTCNVVSLFTLDLKDQAKTFIKCLETYLVI